MYELIILGLLMRWPMHGYLIASIIDDIIGPYAKISHGRLYPLLRRLEAGGRITRTQVAGHTERQPTVYRIESAGRAGFVRLMRETELHRGDYSRVFWIKVAFFDLIEPEERLRLVDHYVTYCEAHLSHLSVEIPDITGRLAGPGFLSERQRVSIVFTLEHAMAQWRLELDQVLRWRRAQSDDGPAETPTGTAVAPPAPSGAPVPRKRPPHKGI